MYLIRQPDVPVPGGNPPTLPGGELAVIRFQDGPIEQAGVNGVTHEVLLAAIIDRLNGFQAGPHACDENSTALMHLHSALAALHDRTCRRLSEGTEGTGGTDVT